MNVKCTLATAFAVAFLVSSSFSVAVQVVDSTPRIIESQPVTNSASSNPPQSYPATSTTTAPTASPPANMQAEMFYRVQVLQQEVSELRGLMEEQAHEIKRLKQQRLDDYVDFDRRLSALSNGASGVSNPSAPTITSSANLENQPGLPVGDELQSYQSAIDAVLKKKDYQKAAQLFNGYLTSFPQGRFAPNSQYWLGEIYLVENDLEQSRKWFSRLVDDYPDHDKTSDARYKLGKIYFLLGDKAKSKQLMNEVSSTPTNAARLAKEFLQQNF